MSQVDWIDEGHEGVKLAYLAAGAGFFYDRHRAVHDCRAAIELLAAPLPSSGALAMQKLLEKARRPSWRIWAENSPFDLKDVLKARGYRWNFGADIDRPPIDYRLPFINARFSDTSRRAQSRCQNRKSQYFHYKFLCPGRSRISCLAADAIT